MNRLPVPVTLAAPVGHGAVAALGAVALVARRRAMRDPNLPATTRKAAAHWLRLHGQPSDRSAANAFLTEPRAAMAQTGAGAP